MHLLHTERGLQFRRTCVRTVIGVQQIVAASRFVFYMGASGTFTLSSKTRAQPVVSGGGPSVAQSNDHPGCDWEFALSIMLQRSTCGTSHLPQAPLSGCRPTAISECRPCFFKSGDIKREFRLASLKAFKSNPQRLALRDSSRLRLGIGQQKRVVSPGLHCQDRARRPRVASELERDHDLSIGLNRLCQHVAANKKAQFSITTADHQGGSFLTTARCNRFSGLNGCDGDLSALLQVRKCLNPPVPVSVQWRNRKRLLCGTRKSHQQAKAR